MLVIVVVTQQHCKFAGSVVVVGVALDSAEVTVGTGPTKNEKDTARSLEKKTTDSSSARLQLRPR